MTWIQTASGRAFDLLNPSSDDVDFEIDIPEALARIARFTGHIRSGPYSVAQHCVIGADYLFHATGDKTIAAAFLLHDAHEAYIGDIATPVGEAIAQNIGAAISTLYLSGSASNVASHVALTMKAMKSRIDEAIFCAAGISFPLPPRMEIDVKYLDLQMLATERKHLLGQSPRKWSPEVEDVEPLKLRGRIQVWPWVRAADEYRARLVAYLPKFPGPVAIHRSRKEPPEA